MSFVHSVACLSLFGLLGGCASLPTTAQQRDAYLQQFIGQSSQTIQKQLDLSQLGYQHVQPPILQDHTLTYTVIRPISIPIPLAQNPLSIATGAIPIPVTPSAQSYDAHLACKIIFRLQDNIAKSVYYTGRTC